MRPSGKIAFSSFLPDDWLTRGRARLTHHCHGCVVLAPCCVLTGCVAAFLRWSHLGVLQVLPSLHSALTPVLLLLLLLLLLNSSLCVFFFEYTPHKKVAAITGYLSSLFNCSLNRTYSLHNLTTSLSLCLSLSSSPSPLLAPSLSHASDICLNNLCRNNSRQILFKAG